MAWIESHQSLRDHPKTRKLSRILGTSLPATIGHLQCLWWWAIDYAEDGNLSRFDAFDIAIGGEWDQDADTFVNALVTVGFLEYIADGLTVHDWDDYAGKLIERRKANAERMRNARAARDAGTNEPRATHVQGTTNARAERQYRTNQTIPTQPTGPDQKEGEASSPPLQPNPPKPSEPDRPLTPSRTPRQLASDKAFDRRKGLYDAWCRGIGLDPDDQESAVGRDVAFRHLKPVIPESSPSIEDFENCTRYLVSQDWRNDPPSIPQVIQGFAAWVSKGRPAKAEPKVSQISSRQGQQGKNIGFTNDELERMIRGEAV